MIDIKRDGSLEPWIVMIYSVLLNSGVCTKKSNTILQRDTAKDPALAGTLKSDIVYLPRYRLSYFVSLASRVVFRSASSDNAHTSYLPSAECTWT